VQFKINYQERNKKKSAANYSTYKCKNCSNIFTQQPICPQHPDAEICNQNSRIQALEAQGANSSQTPKSSLLSPNPHKFLAKSGWQMASHFWLLLLAKFSVIPKPILLLILVFFS